MKWWWGGGGVINIRGLLVRGHQFQFFVTTKEGQSGTGLLTLYRKINPRLQRLTFTILKEHCVCVCALLSCDECSCINVKSIKTNYSSCPSYTSIRWCPRTDFMNIKPIGTQGRLLFQRSIVMVTTDPSDKAVRILAEQEPGIGKTDHSSGAWKTSGADR